MLVLFDNGTPRGVARALAEHRVVEAYAQGWDRLNNGDLLRAAEDAGSEVPVTTDQNIRYQQNLANRKIALVVLLKARWRLIRPVLAEIALRVDAAVPGSYVEAEIPETSST